MAVNVDEEKCVSIITPNHLRKEADEIPETSVISNKPQTVSNVNTVLVSRNVYSGPVK
jgi:hypothetical protein